MIEATLASTLAPRANALANALTKSLQMPARVTAFQDGFRITNVQKNKINLCFEIGN